MTGYTDDEGRFSLINITPGAYHLTARSPSENIIPDWTSRITNVPEVGESDKVTLRFMEELTGMEPNGEAPIKNLTPKLSWNAYLNAAIYELQLNEMECQCGSDRKKIISTNVRKTEFSVESPLLPDTYYRWWVKASDSGGTPIAQGRGMFKTPPASKPNGEAVNTKMAECSK
jgi:hypothetical protein